MGLGGFGRKMGPHLSRRAVGRRSGGRAPGEEQPRPCRLSRRERSVNAGSACGPLLHGPPSAPGTGARRPGSESPGRRGTGSKRPWPVSEPSLRPDVDCGGCFPRTRIRAPPPSATGSASFDRSPPGDVRCPVPGTARSPGEALSPSRAGDTREGAAVRRYAPWPPRTPLGPPRYAIASPRWGAASPPARPRTARVWRRRGALPRSCASPWPTALPDGRRR